MNSLASISADLAAQTESLRRLARDLLGDPHLAEDAVQQAMQAAVERPPRASSALPAWLRTVVRRCALDLRRGEFRRRTRELLARSPLGTESQTHEQVELMQRVLAAVKALPEPYRTTVWLRYYEDRSPSEIAAAQGEPVKTVKTRLWRALARLREVLDGQFGERGAWIALLGPVGAAPKAAVFGAVLMSVKTKLALAGLACAAIALTLIPPEREPTLPARESSASAPSVAAALGDPRPRPATPADAAAAERSPAPAGVAGPVIPSKQPPVRAPTIAIGGVVLDLQAHPVSGVAITGNGTRLVPAVVTDAAGHFDGARAGSVLLGVADERYVAVLQPNLLDEQGHDDLTIVVAPRMRLAGVVVDTEGRPVSGAQITVSLGIELRPRIQRVLDRCIDAQFWRMTPDDGSFAIEAPLGPDTLVHIEARGHRDLDLAAAEAQHLTHFVLERIVTGDTLEGIVVDEQDQPIARAVVWLPTWSVVTKPDGTFRIELWKALDLPPDTVPELTAAASNRLTGKVRALSPDWRSRGAWPSNLRIRLGGATESIRGRVLRHDGTPVADVQVTFAPPEPEQIRPTMFDMQSHMAAALLAGAMGRGVAVPGAFETPRAVPGSYRLRVFDPLTLDMLLTEPIRTGSTDVVVRLPDRGRWPALHGVVVDRRGAPVPGADWMVERDDPTPGAAAPIDGGTHHASESGVIEHPPVSRDVRTLCVRAAGMVEWVCVAIADLPHHEDFRVVVPTGCQVRVEVGASWGNIETVGLMNRAGMRSLAVVTHGSAASGISALPIHDGLSETFVAPEDCVELLLFRGDTCAGRVAITLQPGQMNVLRL